MKALVRYGLEGHDLEIREVPVPAIGPQDVLLRVEAAGICGWDIEQYQMRLAASQIPFIPGHEYCGTVEEIGKEVRHLKKGDRVACETAWKICGVCEVCRKGLYNLCLKRTGFGFGMNGAFSQYTQAPARCLHRLPEELSFEWAALTEPACVAYNAVINKSEIQPGDTVVVMGTGTIGLMCLQMAKLQGARVIVCSVTEDSYRMEIAKMLGADEVWDVRKMDAAQQILDRTEGYGIPLVIDAVGGDSTTIGQAIKMTAPNGQITKVGWFKGTTNTTFDDLVHKGIRLQGTFSHNWPIWERCLQLIAQEKIKVKPMITRSLTLEQWKEGYDLCVQKKAVKVIMKPNSERA